MNRPKLQRLRIGEGQVKLKIHGEPYVVTTPQRYIPALQVEDLYSRTRHYLNIYPISLKNGLEPLRQSNNCQFDGLVFTIRKAANDQFAPYVIEQ